jgi:D-lactate dehydrogenase
MSLPAAVRAALPAQAWLEDAASRHVYGYDNSKRHGAVLAVALPANEAEVQALVRACYASGTPIVARGRGSATTGAAVPLVPSVVVCFERMRAIRRIEPGDRLVEVEAGVINGDLQVALAAHGCFWPPDPSSAPWSTVGGNLACNAGGPRTLKYGACRENLLGLRFVDGRGELIQSGSDTTKGSVGYDLSRLLVGSEGTLGLITAATLKLAPLPEARGVLRALYDSIDAGAAAVAQLMRQALIPAAIEYLDATAVRLVREQAGVALPAKAQALLLIEADGPARGLAEQLASFAAAARVSGCIEVRAAQDDREADELWAARKALSPVLRKLAPKKINEDVVVPVSRLPALVHRLAELSRRHRIPIVNFGHAGNGNLHVNLLYDPAAGDSEARARACLVEVFAAVVEFGGTLSGEHGIGIDKRDFVPLAVTPAALDRMRALQRLFDPAGILNPGKVLPPERRTGADGDAGLAATRAGA